MIFNTTGRNDETPISKLDRNRCRNREPTGWLEDGGDGECPWALSMGRVPRENEKRTLFMTGRDENTMRWEYIIILDE